MTFNEAVAYTRLLLGERSAAFWKDTEVVLGVQRAYVEIYTELVQQNEDHFTTSGNISYVSGTQLYTLPGSTSGTPRIRFIERQDLDPKIELRPCRLEEKNQYESTAVTNPFLDGTEKYFILAGQLGITPTPRSAITNALRVFYVPVPAIPTTGGSFIQELNELHHELICWGAFLRLITKDRELVQAHMPHFERLMKLMRNDTARRQTQEPIGFSMAYGD